MQEHDQPFGAPPLPPPPAMSGIPAMPVVDRSAVRDLASRQRAAIVAGIANALAGALLFTHSLPEGTGALISLVVAAYVIVAAFRLAQRLHGAWIGGVCGVAMLVPVGWIVVLALLSSKASKQLRAAGVHVGFFGANPSSV
jgi:hypothetical protein